MRAELSDLLEATWLEMELSESYTDDELLEELEAFLSSPELVQLAEKSKPGFLSKAAGALKNLFSKKAKKPVGGGGPKRKLAPDEKMVFGVVRKVGKNGKLLPKKDAEPKSAKPAKKSGDEGGKADFSTKKVKPEGKIKVPGVGDVEVGKSQKFTNPKAFSGEGHKRFVKMGGEDYEVSTIPHGKGFQTVVFDKAGKQVVDETHDGEDAVSANKSALKFLSKAAKNSKAGKNAWESDD